MPTSTGASGKQESSRKTSALWTMSKPLTIWITTNWKILQEMGIPDHLTCLLKKQQLELDMEKQTGSKSGKLVPNCHPAYLTYMQGTSCEMPGWTKHKLESRFPGEISITSDMQMAESEEEVKEP